jgi:hypothetical protein
MNVGNRPCKYGAGSRAGTATPSAPSLDPLDVLALPWRGSRHEPKEDRSGNKFTVHLADAVLVQVEVGLKAPFVNYQHKILTEAGFPSLNRSAGVLKISADADGHRRVRKDGETFVDEAEISEFLLLPLLEHGDG